MKKTLANGTIFTIAHVLFGLGGNTGLLNKKQLKTRIAVRQALKFNHKVISDAYNTINEMMQDIQKELFDEFLEADKATKTDEMIEVKEEFRDEFTAIYRMKLDELSAQTVDLEVQMIPEDKYLAYAEQNDGELTDAELDVLEVFVEFAEDTEEIEKVEGEVVE